MEASYVIGCYLHTLVRTPRGCPCRPTVTKVVCSCSRLTDEDDAAFDVSLMLLLLADLVPEVDMVRSIDA